MSDDMDRSYPPGVQPPFGITAMIPCYNEVACIDQAYSEVRAALDRYDDVEILFVDDGSTDGTLERIRELAGRDPDVHYVSFARNFGLEAAFSAGYRYASKPWTVQLDADLQSPPREMHKLIERCLQGYDVAFAVRAQRRDAWWRRMGTWFHQMIASRWLGIELPLGASVFRVARTSVAQKVVASRLSTPYFIATAPLIGARYTTVVTDHDARRDGEGKWRMRDLATHATELFVGFSYRPLTITYLAATAIAGLALALVVVLAIRGDALALVPLLTLVVSAAGAVVSAVVARYLIRVMRVQAIGSPAYQIRESNIPVRPADALYGFEAAALPVAAGQEVS